MTYSVRERAPVFHSEARQGHFLRPTNLILGTILFGLSVTAGWPGLLNADGLWMMIQAKGETDAIYGWHSPFLTWMWGFLGAGSHGPLGPFLVQSFSYWLGVTLLSCWVSWKRETGLSLLVFPILVLWPGFFITLWVTKDGFAVAFLSLGIGLLLSSHAAKQGWLSTALLLAGASSIGIALVPRWYLLPVLSVAILIVGTNFGRSVEKLGQAVLGVGVALLTLSSLLYFEGRAIAHVDENPQSSVMLLDHLRVECSSKNRIDSPALMTVVPESLVVRWDEGQELCENFYPFRLAPYRMWSSVDAPKFAQALSNQEAGELTDSWLKLWEQNAPVLIEARSDMLVEMLTNSNYSWAPGVSKAFQGGGAYARGSSLEPEAWPNYVPISVRGALTDLEGTPYSAWDNMGGLALVILSFPSSLMPSGIPLVDFTDRGLLWLVVIPALSYFLFGRTGKFSIVRFLAPFVPFSLAVVMVALAPADNFRYFAAGVFLSLVFALGLYCTRKD